MPSHPYPPIDALPLHAFTPCIAPYPRFTPWRRLRTVLYVQVLTAPAAATAPRCLTHRCSAGGVACWHQGPPEADLRLAYSPLAGSLTWSSPAFSLRFPGTACPQVDLFTGESGAACCLLPAATCLLQLARLHPRSSSPLLHHQQRAVLQQHLSVRKMLFQAVPCTFCICRHVPWSTVPAQASTRNLTLPPSLPPACLQPCTGISLRAAALRCQPQSSYYCSPAPASVAALVLCRPQLSHTRQLACQAAPASHLRPSKWRCRLEGQQAGQDQPCLPPHSHFSRRRWRLPRVTHACRPQPWLQLSAARPTCTPQATPASSRSTLPSPRRRDPQQPASCCSRGHAWRPGKRRLLRACRPCTARQAPAPGLHSAPAWE